MTVASSHAETRGPRGRTFHLLAKPTGAVCNLDCAYCFFLSKEMLYPGSRFRMADGLLDEYCDSSSRPTPAPPRSRSPGRAASRR